MCHFARSLVLFLALTWPQMVWRNHVKYPYAFFAHFTLPLAYEFCLFTFNRLAHFFSAPSTVKWIKLIYSGNRNASQWKLKTLSFCWLHVHFTVEFFARDFSTTFIILAANSTAIRFELCDSLDVTCIYADRYSIQWRYGSLFCTQVIYLIQSVRCSHSFCWLLV